MYTQYFGLREIPFSITPDPAFLYLSPRHQEALGHLLYGTGQYGGFVQLTGEVGTGKTTIVRTLLSQKLDDVDVAVVLNPRQNEEEFVASICDELGVKYPKRASLKALVDALNAHLLDAHARNRRTVLIIDEAQNLRPEVLEQVRLLTNLETHKEKLLRIMLVGQPELAALLARPDLRQLAQRITARYHLTPLQPAETAAYIAHRLTVAGGDPALFMPRACEQVHRYAGGVPRLINILCDRALLGAYAVGQRQVTPDLVRRAAAEVGVELTAPRPRRPSLADAAVVTAIVAAGAAWFWHEQQSRPLEASDFAPSAPVATTDPAPSPVPAETATTEGATTSPEVAGATLDELLRTAQPLPVVLSRLVHLWNTTPRVRPGESICQALERVELSCYKSLGEWRDLRQMNRPAILTLSSGRGGIQHVLLRELADDHAVLETAAGPLHLSLAELDLLWTGEFLMLWRRESPDTVIGPDARPESIAWLRQRLAQLEDRPLAASSAAFDDELRQALLRFQASQGLERDGLAGPRTLIALSNRQLTPGTPTLLEPATENHVAHP